MPGEKWTKEQEQYLKDNFVEKTCEEIAISGFRRSKIFITLDKR
jgi:hypothetical protein